MASTDAPSQPPPAPESSAFAMRVMQEARSLALLCDGFWTDLARCEEERESVAFAIDSDVVKLYTSPVGNAVYGHIFSDHPPGTAAHTASLLGDYIVRRMRSCIGVAADGKPSQDIGLIVFPPHAKELQRIALAIQHDAIQKSSRRPPMAAELAAELDDILQSNNPSASDKERAAKILAEHGWLLDTESPPTADQEHQRLEMLPAGRFLPLRAHPWFADESGGKLLPPKLPRTLMPHTQLPSDGTRFAQSIDLWYERLLAVHLSDFNSSPTDYRRLKLLTDAEVLAQLEWVNRELASAGNLNRRVILVTGTPTILRAAATVTSPLQGFDSFADAYLRDPRTFLGAKDLAPAPHQPESPRENPLTELRSSEDRIRLENIELHLADWLAVFFPRASFQRRFDVQRATGTTGSTVRVRFEAPTDEELQALWLGDSEGNPGLSALSGFPDKELSTLGESLQQIAQRVWGELASQFNREAWNEIRRRWANVAQDPAERITMVLRQRELGGIDQVFGLVAKVGAQQLLAPHLKMKGLPALRFDAEFASAQQQCVLLCDKLFLPGQPDRQFDMAEMESTVNKDDASGYHARVLRAYVFACAGLWFQVRPLCLSALLTVNAIPDKRPDDRRLGREAAYLLAVAERRLAVNVEGVKNARTALNDARLRNHLPSDLRFDSEALAQTVTEIQLKIFSDIGPAKPVDWRVLISLSQQYAEAAKAETPSIIRRWVVRQSVTNGLLLCLMAKHLKVGNAQLAGPARALMKALAEERLAPVLPGGPEQAVQQYADGVSDMIWLVAAAVFDAEPARARAARALLESDYTGTHDDQTSFVERARLAALFRLAGVDQPIKPAEHLPAREASMPRSPPLA